MKLDDIKIRFNRLKNDIVAQNDDRNGWIRPKQFMEWVGEFNKAVVLLNKETDRDIRKEGVSDNDYSSTRKTIKTDAANRLKRNINSVLKEITMIEEKKEPQGGFKCFKIGHRCPHDIKVKKRQCFIGMPFDRKFDDSFEFGIKLILESHGFSYYKSDEKATNIDIMCKICKNLQKSEYAIINISDLNPNVMFELGLAYGMEKEVIIIKDKETKDVSDLKGIEYAEYSNVMELQKQLKQKLTGMGLI